MCEVNYFSLVCKWYLVLFLTFIIPTPVLCCTTKDLGIFGIFWYCSRHFWSCICESPGHVCYLAAVTTNPCLMRQNAAGAIFPLDEHDGWSGHMTKFSRHDLLSWSWGDVCNGSARNALMNAAVMVSVLASCCVSGFLFLCAWTVGYIFTTEPEPLHYTLNQGSPNYGPQVTSGPWSHSIWPMDEGISFSRTDILSIMKKQYSLFTKHFLIW